MLYEDCITNKGEDCGGLQNNSQTNRFTNFLLFLRQIHIASHSSRSARKYLRSHASIAFERRRHLQQYYYIIHPFSLLRFWWDIFMIIVLLNGFIWIPFQAAYDMERTAFPWTIVKNMMLLICCCDIIINFFTGFFNKSDSVVELRFKAIAVTYLKKRFVLDLLGSSFTDLIFINKWETAVVEREVYSLIFVLRLFSFVNYSDILARDFAVRRALYDFFGTIFYLVLVLHWQACISWLVPVAAASFTTVQRPNNDSWLVSSHLWESESNFEQYGHCFLRSIATFLHAGFLSLSEPNTEEDQYVVIIFYFIGTIGFCFMIARVMQFFKGINSSKLKFQAALAHLSQYMSHKQLPRKTQRRIVDFYEFRFQSRFFRETEILSTLSIQMRQEIRMHSCRKLVENVTFFNNLPIALLARIVSLLKAEVFLTNDLIVRANQTGDCMYYIATGTVAVYTSTGKEVCHLEDGAHFGEIALVMPDAKRVASVVAVETCKLYKLERGDFARTIHPYPMLWERIKKIAIERHEKTTILNTQ